MSRTVVPAPTATLTPAALPMLPFDPAELWRHAKERVAAAKRAGVLHPLAAQLSRVTDGTMHFVLRELGDGHRPLDPNHGGGGTPFAAPEPALTLCNLGQQHRLLLNKFPVIAPHLLIVTRAFEPQERGLSAADFAAAAACLRAPNALAFYNAGPIAGASQPHRHLQLVPQTLGAGDEPLPITDALGALPCDASPGRAPLPFTHAALRWRRGSADGEPAQQHRAYRRLLDLCDLSGARCSEPLSNLPPHNLLWTDEWMLLVPRRRERFGTISVNALGYAGALLVRTQTERQQLLAHGPAAVLAELAG